MTFKYPGLFSQVPASLDNGGSHSSLFFISIAVNECLNSGCCSTECLHMSQPLPMAFCYVPSQQQIQQHFNKKTKTKKQSSTVVTSPVDRKILFFGSQRTCGEGQVFDAGKSGPESMWGHMQQDKLWQTVLEYYYGLCNVSQEKRSQAMNVYIRRRVKHKNEKRESQKCFSYAEIAHKLGILSVKTHMEVSKRESENSEELKRNDSDGALCTTSTESTSHCSSTTGCNSTEEPSSNDFPVNVSCSTLTSSSNDSIRTDSDQTHKAKLTNKTGKCQSLEISLQKSSDSDVLSQGSVSDECRTTCTTTGSNGAKYTNVLIDMEREVMEQLCMSPSGSWSINDDIVLVHFLCDICEKSDNRGRSKVNNDIKFCKHYFKIK